MVTQVIADITGNGTASTVLFISEGRIVLHFVVDGLQMKRGIEMITKNAAYILCTLFVCLGLIFVGPFHALAQSPPVLPDIDISKSDIGVVDMPDHVDDVFKAFAKYTKIYAPNGKPIHIVVYSGISDKQIVYARKVLVNHLTNVAGSLYGSDKTPIANTLADNNAIMAFYINRASMQTDAVRNFERSGVKSQAQHTPPPIMEGTALYMKNDPGVASCLRCRMDAPVRTRLTRNKPAGIAVLRQGFVTQSGDAAASRQAAFQA